jgi:hypothetical protein
MTTGPERQSVMTAEKTRHLIVFSAAAALSRESLITNL